MLRRQIANKEYIALTKEEFKNLATSNIPSSNLQAQANPNQTNVVSSPNALSDGNRANWLHEIYFVVPVIKNIRGYYETQMQIVNTGKIVHAKVNDGAQFSVQTDTNRELSLRGSTEFIRWLGL